MYIKSEMKKYYYTFDPHQSQNLESALLTRPHLVHVSKRPSFLAKGGADSFGCIG